MPGPVIAALGARAGAKVAQKIRAKLAGKRAPAGRAPVVRRRRARRIVFSENQWMFVQSLLRSAGGVRVPSFPKGGRRRRRRGPFA